MQPALSDAAAAKLVSVYADMRRDGRERKVVVATPRQLESLIRLSEAHSRMRLKETVGAEEVEAATRLWWVCGGAFGVHSFCPLHVPCNPIITQRPCAPKHVSLVHMCMCCHGCTPTHTYTHPSCSLYTALLVHPHTTMLTHMHCCGCAPTRTRRYTAMSGSAAGAHGGIDLENIHTGQSAAQRERQKNMVEDLRRMFGASGW